MKTYRLTALLVIFILVLSACNMPSSQAAEPTNNPNAVFTAAAETVVAQLTQNALLVPPTAMPAATNVPPTNIPAPEVVNTPAAAATIAAPATAAVAQPTAATSSCDAAQFISDVTIPDGTVFASGATFVKTWRIKNIGTCTWNSSYALVFVSDNAMGGPASTSMASDVAPGGAIDISVNLQAPASDGTYRGYWGITNAAGQRLPIKDGASGKSFYVEIKVGSGTGTGDTGSGKFAVTSVGFNVDRSGACGSMQYTVTATVTANRDGLVTYKWIRSDGATGDSMSGTLTFEKAGSKTINFVWTFGGGNQWVDLYIDKPNHQTFGHALLNCP